MAMRDMNRQATQPLPVPRTRRNHAVAVLTSMPAGKCVPLAAIPLLREDGCTGRMQIAVEMMETKELLMNPVYLRVTAYVVPLLALERFEGSRDQFDRSYMGEPQIDGGDVIDFIETHAMGAHGSNEVYKALGLHGKSTDQVNTAYLEAVNAIWNFRATNRSKDITPRARLATTLPPAFWNSSRFQHVLPDFDQAQIDGEVALNVVNAQLPVSGIGITVGNGNGSTNTTVKDSTTDAAGVVYPFSRTIDPPMHMRFDSAGAAALPLVFAEMAQNGITVSLSNIDMARKTQAFAKLREQFDGIDDEHIIDMLMAGLSIPDQQLKQPILISDQTVRFSQAKRYATDSTNLAESAVSGGAMLSVNLRVPRLSTGGVIIVQAECIPEQLFERQRDPFFHASDVETDFPEYVRDTLDPEKVDVILNGQIDTDHATPAATFGFGPLNWKWNNFGPRVGGKFYRPTTNTVTDAERTRLWAVEDVNPVLSSDFYVVNAIHTKPFLDPDADPFEATVIGNAVIDGLTVFGGVLVEATNNYDTIAAQAPVERIEKD